MDQRSDRFKLVGYVPNYQAKMVKRLAFERDCSMSVIIREALFRYFEALPEQERERHADREAA